jgi:glutamyl-tRNA(Gln) amidotransferase subunit E
VSYLPEEEVNVKIGLEIHFQVKGRKLFCEDMGEETEKYLGSFTRRLRLVSGERSGVDIAAILESTKGTEFEYIITENSCLVEMDEEPPHYPSKEAIDTAVLVSLALNCKIVDNLHFMRKIVIDGSNTSGFQRTGIVGLKGEFYAVGKKVRIATVTLEEEACKKLKEEAGKVTYSLDRLGIPLIEISTEPDISSPKEAREIAESIGITVRRSRMIRREVSSIRQDLNISIEGGNRVEIKGVQSLSQIEKVLLEEIERQKSLLKIRKILKDRGAGKFQIELVDISDFDGFDKSDMISKGLGQGKRAYGFRLPYSAGVLKKGEMRLGKEIAERLKVIGIGGILHSDELPDYGISQESKEELSAMLDCGHTDAFGLIICDPEIKDKASEIISTRMNEALLGVPAETRAAVESSTRFMRPLPGSSRMYPETDIPLIELPEDYVRDLKGRVPDSPAERIDYLSSIGIPRQEALNSIKKEYDDILEDFVKNYGNPGISASLLAVVFATEDKDVERARKIMKQLVEGKIAKEAVMDMYTGKNSGKYTGFAKGEAVPGETNESWEQTVERITNENMKTIEERGEDALKPLMGEIMKELRGKVDGKIISDKLKEEIRRIAGRSTK